MQVQLRQRRGLLSRASTLAIIAAASAGGLGVVPQAMAACPTSIGPGSVSTPQTCVVASGVVGDVTVDAPVGPDPANASFFVGKGGIFGSLTNNSLITGGHIDGGESTFGALTIEGDVTEGIFNDSQITSGTGNAVQIGYTSGGEGTSGHLTGTITNSAGISGGTNGNGIAALFGTTTGGLVNEDNGVITGGVHGVYIADTFTSWSGGIQNNGSIHADFNGDGIHIGDVGQHNVEFSGGILNNGEISTVNGAGIYAGGASFDGNVENWGLITQTGSLFSGYGGSGIVFDATTVTGDIINYGTIEGLFRQGILVTNSVSEFNSSISNFNYIDGAEGGVIVRATTVNGNFNNSGLITGGFTGVGYFVSDINGPGGEGFTANFSNTGSIIGEAGFVILANTVNADFVNGGGEGQALIQGTDSAGVVLNAYTWNGNITNDGTGAINGHLVGLAVGYDPFNGKSSPGNSLTGNIVNNGFISATTNGTISSFMTGGAIIMVDNYTGNFTNNGTIVGGRYGVAISGAGLGCTTSCSFSALSLGGGTFNGNITNTGLMSGNTALFVSYDNVNGNLSNTITGVLQGADHGLFVDVDNFQGNFSNAGTITAGGEGSSGIAARIGYGSTEAGFVLGGQTFTGDISNTASGFIHGDDTGLSVVLDSYTGGEGGEGFTNAGTIVGDDQAGLYVNVNTWQGNFTNEAGGFIEGGVTGAFFNAGTINGTFANHGTIIGHGSDTGWSINTPSFTGNIVNGPLGVITAPSNALHLNIGTFTGQISNAGLIAASTGNAAVLEGYGGNGNYNGAFTNTGLITAGNIGIYLNSSQITGGISNDGGTIIAPTAISTQNATAATTITNEGDGLIIGDLRLSDNHGDTFIGMDGGIVGDIIGDPGSSGGEGGEGGGANDDIVNVQGGSHYFVGKGGTASNLLSFNVNNGGTALMGAEFEGDTNGSGYSFSNVDAINVNNGGTLYIDKSTTLTADTYTQQSGGTLEFYLGAPGGSGFSSLTGDQVADPATDYGQIHVTGAATLNGTIAGFLDPEFANSNADLTSVTYNDVLVADGGISGDFSTLALINNNSIFELNEVIEGNTVDLTITRSAVGQVGDVGGILVELGGPWKSMVNDRSTGVGSGSCGLAGPGWCLNAYAANDAGGSAVMTDASPGADPFDWLRTGVRRVGETAVWGRAVGVWGDTDGDNIGHSGTDFDTVGAIIGVDHVFTPILMAGIAGQYTTTDIDFDGLPDNAEVNSFEIGGYMSYGDARFYLNANASVIFHEIDVTRFAPGGRAFGNYDGQTLSAYAEIGRIFETYEGFRIQPLAALSFAHLDTDSYDETGSATSLLHVFDSELDSLKSMLGARFAYPIGMASGRKLVPEARVIWAHEFMDDQSSFLANPLSNPLNISTITGEEYSRDTFILGAGLTAPLSDATSLFVDYDAGLNQDITTHTLSGGFRTRW